MFQLYERRIKEKLKKLFIWYKYSNKFIEKIANM